MSGFDSAKEIQFSRKLNKSGLIYSSGKGPDPTKQTFSNRLPKSQAMISTNSKLKFSLEGFFEFARKLHQIQCTNNS